MKPFVTLFILAIVTGVQAQPVLTFPENAPVPGTSYLLHFGPFVDPGSAGADQTWDLSGLTTDSTMNIVLAAPGMVIGNEAFPGATVAETPAAPTAGGCCGGACPDAGGLGAA